MKRRFKALFIHLVITVLAVGVGLSVAQAKQTGQQRLAVTKDGKQAYVVVMQQASTFQQMKARQTAKGAKINLTSRTAQQIRKTLISEHDRQATVAGVNPRNVIHHYTNAFNGFAALMTASQANELARQPGVISVRLDEMRYKHTDNSPSFLRLDVRKGPWDKGINGENVVVGVIDTGIWPEHPSFEDDGSYEPLPIVLDESVRPACDFGNIAHNPEDVPFTCNNKLIGARMVMDTYRAVLGMEPEEFDSARDDDGHGTHTASTTAGNADVDASIFGISRGSISGIAPRARVIAYRGLGLEGGFGSDLAAAIDQAVADGVDVINYSIGGGASLTGADDLAYLFAADAGVFAATSAGNSGPNPETMGGPGSVPWITTVGASSQNRTFISKIKLKGPGRAPKRLWGATVTPGLKKYNLVDAEGIADITGNTAGTCSLPFPTDSFDVYDAIICNMTDGGRNRATRAFNVAMAGGGAVVYHNSPALNNTPTDNNVIPTVHMLHDVGNPLKSYITDYPGEVTISFKESDARYWPRDRRVVPNMMAYFSSRGPNPAAFDIIKPDVTAPGLMILAGASPNHVGLAAQDELFQAIQGTSMSSPHVAGAFALLKQAHPDWSPAMAKSALMTTAYQHVVDNDGVSDAGPFAMGAGHIRPGGRVAAGSVYQPGLVYDAGFSEYLGFLCDAAPRILTNPEETCATLEAAGVPTKAINLNLPSIGVSDLPGRQVVQRTVTSVAETPGKITYRAVLNAPEGYELEVTPSELVLGPGESATYSLAINNVTSTIGEWAFGSIQWMSQRRYGHRDDADDDNDEDDEDYEGNSRHHKKWKYKVYSPIAVRASLFNAPEAVFGLGADGSAAFDITFGYSGDYTAFAHGLYPAATIAANVVQDPDQDFDPNDGFSNLHEFNLSGSAHFRVAIPPEAAEVDSDLDVFVYDPNGDQVATSTKSGTDEVINIELPMDGVWQVYVQGWSAPGGDSDYTLYSWDISATPGGSLTLDYAPNTAVMGAVEPIGVSWMGTLDQWYLGAVSHNRGSELFGMTFVEVDNRP